MRLPMYVAARECTDKRAYPTRREAKRVQRIMEERTGEDFKRYRCRICGDYHVAHRVPSGMREDTRERARQIEKDALAALRDRAERYGLAGLLETA